MKKRNFLLKLSMSLVFAGACAPEREYRDYLIGELAHNIANGREELHRLIDFDLFINDQNSLGNQIVSVQGKKYEKLLYKTIGQSTKEQSVNMDWRDEKQLVYENSSLSGLGGHVGNFVVNVCQGEATTIKLREIDKEAENQTYITYEVHCGGAFFIVTTQSDGTITLHCRQKAKVEFDLFKNAFARHNNFATFVQGSRGHKMASGETVLTTSKENELLVQNLYSYLVKQKSIVEMKIHSNAQGEDSFGTISDDDSHLLDEILESRRKKPHGLGLPANYNVVRQNLTTDDVANSSRHPDEYYVIEDHIEQVYHRDELENQTKRKDVVNDILSALNAAYSKTYSGGANQNRSFIGTIRAEYGATVVMLRSYVEAPSHGPGSRGMIAYLQRLAQFLGQKKSADHYGGGFVGRFRRLKKRAKLLGRGPEYVQWLTGIENAAQEGIRQLNTDPFDPTR
ncbi:MAG: hypothetical protein AAF320_03910 [Myxococcota bacterium]